MSVVRRVNLFDADVRHDADDPAQVARAAVSLRRVHAALATYGGELPPFRTRFERCRALLADPHALPALAAADRRFPDRLLASSMWQSSTGWHTKTAAADPRSPPANQSRNCLYPRRC